MGTQMIGSQGGGKQQSQFQSLAKQSSMFGTNLDDFLEPAELEITSSESASGFGVQHQASMARSSWDLGKLTQHRRPMNGGGMTLEDFLAKAEAVADARTDVFSNARSTDGTDHQSSGTRDYLQEVHRRPQVVGQMSGATEEPPETRARGLRKVVVRDIAKKTVEGRQKRMIKNRESASRSRARKQAYTQELEIKVSQLEEENKKLRKQKELDEVLQNMVQPKLTHKPRRTSSAQF